MNYQQLAYLEYLDVPVWLSADRDLKILKQPKSVVETLCVVDHQQWQQEACKALFVKIMGALGWSRPKVKVVTTMNIKTFEANQVVLFGAEIDSSPFKTSEVLVVSSLEEMLSSPTSKKATWTQLKPFSKG